MVFQQINALRSHSTEEANCCVLARAITAPTCSFPAACDVRLLGVRLYIDQTMFLQQMEENGFVVGEGKLMELVERALMPSIRETLFLEPSHRIL